jgi:hypothetical protein
MKREHIPWLIILVLGITVVAQATPVYQTYSARRADDSAIASDVRLLLHEVQAIHATLLKGNVNKKLPTTLKEAYSEYGCAKCHGEKTPAKGLALVDSKGEPVVLSQKERAFIQRVISRREMPLGEDGKPQPLGDTEIKAFVKLLSPPVE